MALQSGGGERGSGPNLFVHSLARLAGAGARARARARARAGAAGAATVVSSGGFTVLLPFVPGKCPTCLRFSIKQFGR